MVDRLVERCGKKCSAVTLSRLQDAEGVVSRQKTARADEIQLRRDSEVRGALARRQPEQMAADGMVHRRYDLPVLLSRTCCLVRVPRRKAPLIRLSDFGATYTVRQKTEPIFFSVHLF